MSDPDRGISALDGAYHTVTEYSVSALPPDHPDWRHSCMKVAYRENGRWTVQRDMFELVARDGKFRDERLEEPNRTAWREAYLMELPVALEVAATVARTLYINGRHVLDILKETADE